MSVHNPQHATRAEAQARAALPPPFRSLSELDLPRAPELEECIRCGLCLSVCPTYRPTGVEGDSPRGRVALVKAQVEGKADPASAAFQRHMDLCLQCMACFTICPTGVNAGATVARQKASVRVTRQRTLTQRVLYHVLFKGLFPHYGRLELLAAPLHLYQRSGLRRLARRMGLFKHLPARLGLMEALLPERMGRPARVRIATVTPSRSARRFRVALHLCCMNNILFPDACIASVRVLARNGAEVVTPKNVACCGAPHETEGEMELGRALARRNIALYERLGVDYVIADAAACGAALKQYGHWLRHDTAWRERAARFSVTVRDIHEFLIAADMEAPENTLRVRVTYDDPCHLCHAQGITAQPRAILKAIPGIDFVELPEAQWCCGSAGIYNVTQPAMAATILQDKMEHIRDTGAAIIASCNPGCMLQLEAGLRYYGMRGKIRHVMELLDEAYGD